MPFQNLLKSVVGMCVCLFLVFFLPSSYAFSQHHISIGSNPPENTFQNALDLFEQQHYEAAQKIFSSYITSETPSFSLQNKLTKRVEAIYYLRLCELYLKKTYAEANSIEFINQYEQTLYADNLKLALANSFYEEANYRRAAYYFAPLEKSRPTTKEELEINFRLAYSYFKIKRKREALQTFSSLQSKNNEYYAQASYYIGFINYELGSFQEAIKYLNQAKSDTKYTESANKLIAKSYYSLEDCQSLSDFVSSIANEKHDIELFYYAAQCAYLNEEFDLAYEWFGRYKRNSKQLSDSVAYQYLNTLYVTERYDEFLDYQTSFLAGGTFYSPILLMKASIYEKQSNYKKAASTYDELAAYNPSDAEKVYFSKLKNLYLSEEYDFLITESKAFESKFPQSIYLSEITLFTANALAVRQGSKIAMSYLKARNATTNQEKIKETYVHLALQSIKELFNQSSYDEMSEMISQFKNEIQLNDSLQNFVNFYTAEALLQTQKVGKAESYYKKIPASSRFYADAKYGMGVINFNKASYSSAAKQQSLILLEEYLSTPTGIVREKAVDALTRVATIYAANKHYEEAEVNFMKALNLGDSETEYINFALGQVYFVQTNYSKAIYQFDKVMRMPNSLYTQYSQLMKIAIYENQANRKQVIALSNDFIKRYPQSEKLSEALLSRGNAKAELKQYKSAINDYTALIMNYPTSKDAVSALNALGNFPDLYNIEVENLEELRGIYASHNSNYNPNNKNNIATTTNSNPAAMAVIQKEFDVGFNLYKSNDISAAIIKFRDIVSKNEIAGTIYYDQIHYYLGKSYEKYGDNFQAIKNLQRVGGKLQTSALSDIGDIEFNRENYNSAITSYEGLAKIAPNDAIRVMAWEKLTKTYYMQEDYETANDYLAIIRNKKANANNDFVRLYESKILAGLQQIDEAIEGFSKLGNDRQANPKYASEALYELAELMHSIGDNQSAKSILQDLRNQFAEQKETQQKANKLALKID
ncbi:tetratricopeptide repeat protein [Bernardetia sp. ABR2-2B]|uniref:tetratricopeptide repeat protein n=1 Tax=Bernardetia sp. ABR2-2B TaxID=3127472 RepID=UPI0030CF3B7B